MIENVYVVEKTIMNNERYVEETGSVFCDISDYTLMKHKTMKVFSSLESAKSYVASKEDHLSNFNYFQIRFNEDKTRIEGFKSVKDYYKYTTYSIKVMTLED